MTIQTTDRNGADLDIAAKEIGPTKFPRNIITDPAGNDMTPASEATMQALLTAAQAIQAAAVALNTKTTAVNTGAIGGTVAVSNMVAQGLTDTELRATPLALPVGAATETTLAALASAVGQHNGAALTGRDGLVTLVRRRDVDSELTVADGDFTFLNVNDEGRLKVTTKPAVYADVTGSITAVQSAIGTPVVGGTVVGDVSRASNVMAFCYGTFSTVNCAFEGSLEDVGDTNWFSVQAVRSNANTIETTTGNLSAQPVYAWELSVNALARLRVRCTARTSGTQNWRFKLGTYATEPIPAAQISGTQPISGTVTANQGTLVAPGVLNLNSAATTNLTAVKTSAGTLYNIVARNTGAGPAFLKLYNKNSAPVVASDVPVMTLELAPGVPLVINFGAVGHRFAAGIGMAITGATADNDATAVAAGQVRALVSFI